MRTREQNYGRQEGEEVHAFTLEAEELVGEGLRLAGDRRHGSIRRTEGSGERGSGRARGGWGRAGEGIRLGVRVRAYRMVGWERRAPEGRVIVTWGSGDGAAVPAGRQRSGPPVRFGRVGLELAHGSLKWACDWRERFIYVRRCNITRPNYRTKGEPLISKEKK